jgi:hypothetical protein
VTVTVFSDMVNFRVAQGRARRHKSA